MITQSDFDALQLRYDALSRDWDRQREIEWQWRRLIRWSYRLLVVVLLVSLLAACDTSDKHCARWKAFVQGYEMCAADPSCKMSAWKYRHLREARIERASWCSNE